MFDGLTGITVSSQSFVTSDEFSDLTYTINATSSGGWDGSSLSPSGNYVINSSFYASAARPTPTFKHGCDHEFGIVYYDRYNRSGFVNKIGSANVAFIGDKQARNSGSAGREGAASISISIPDTYSPPDWAVKWQIVYGGMSTYDSVFSYTTGYGYPIRDVSDPSTSVTHPIKTGSKQIYLSLKTLDLNKQEKGSSRDYSYTVGDKLRVISYKQDDGTRVYPMDNNSVNPSPIEFDVVGVVTLSDDQTSNIIHDTGSSIEDKYTGTFLILDCPEVNSGKQVDANGDGNVNDDLKFIGFDWFSITGQNYPNDSNSTITNYWGRESVVEILTPRKNTSERVYYEIGEAHQANGYLGVAPINQHGSSVTITDGDVRFRLVSCKTPSYVNSTWTTGTPGDWVYETVFLEDSSVSDAFPSKDWSRGRPHVAFENAAKVRRLNGITYSDAYAEDVANLSISSFNQSLANFDSLDVRYGAVEYIGNYNDDLVAIQENKFCLIPVNKNILEYASGSADVAVSSTVLGQRRYSSGDYGSGGNPEAALIQDNSVYFVDKSRQAVLSLTGGQLVPISEKSMSSFFEAFFSTNNDRYVSGYDPRDNTYYITALGGSTPETVGYDVARGVWQSKYSFTPDIYSNQDNMLYSAKYVNADTDLIFHKHDNTTAYNTFYGGAASPSTVQVVSKLSPSRVKVYNAISYESDSGKWDVVGNTDITTNLSQETGGITSWRENEGSYYAAMPRDKSSNSTSEEIHIGDLTLDSGTKYNVAGARLNRLHIPLDVDLTIAGETNQVTAYTATTITFNTALSSPTTNMKLELAGEGDSIRGHFSKIKLTLPSNDAATKLELYCINTHVTDSKSHHPLGQ